MSGSDPAPIVFGDSLGVGAATTGGMQSYAVGGKPSAWILSSIEKNSKTNNQETLLNRDILLSSGASNDALNAVAIWARKLPAPRTLTSSDIQEIKQSAAYVQFKKNVTRAIETLVAHGACKVFIMGVEDGPVNAPDYVRHKHDHDKTVALVPGGAFKALGINADLAILVADYKRAHPEQAARIVFGGAATRSGADGIHPSTEGYKKIVSDAYGFFQSGAVPSVQALPAGSVAPLPQTPGATVAARTPRPRLSAQGAQAPLRRESKHPFKHKVRRRHAMSPLRVEHGSAPLPPNPQSTSAQQTSGAASKLAASGDRGGSTVAAAPTDMESQAILAAAVPYTQLQGHEKGRTADYITGKPPQRKPASPTAGS